MRALYVLSFVSISFNKTYNGNAYDRVCKMKCVRWGVYNGNAYDGLHPSLMNCALSGLVLGVSLWISIVGIVNCKPRNFSALKGRYSSAMGVAHRTMGFAIGW